ncbi:Conserved protein of unknown function; putative Plasmid stabilization system [Bradyrhizobium sp. ORS 285]|uniref:type II toxin-antitoxin system RelE/ParE family toxin n=1 Tax=Bradyrhizobium sp. ORS 285 TaxID=115808 RepID=UPI000240AC94|nr:type II toxin-antitoxin system RelE/ParE family toxin [Bradyrhizobium sp. ORS 285]CCD90018.1 Conserved hypothetical protein; putative Plasmid stabilization system [Bradyrhizobium sp. ORS 285]SMX61280.1 Conserved protein of unknown function; putative Plasmid stabilization system [Bradyrhizobium sp. ORS 285]
MRLRFTSRALDDLREIAAYLHDLSPTAAQHVRGDILRCLERLTAFPRMGRQQNLDGVRKSITRKYFYLVYYALDEADREIVVLSIRHPSREREHEDC